MEFRVSSDGLENVRIFLREPGESWNEVGCHAFGMPFDFRSADLVQVRQANESGGRAEAEISQIKALLGDFSRRLTEVELTLKRQQVNPLCPHEQDPADCEACMKESDFQYDSAREKR